jgi:hypothetical protein
MINNIINNNLSTNKFLKNDYNFLFYLIGSLFLNKFKCQTSDSSLKQFTEANNKLKLTIIDDNVNLQIKKLYNVYLIVELIFRF